MYTRTTKMIEEGTTLLHSLIKYSQSQKRLPVAENLTHSRDRPRFIGARGMSEGELQELVFIGQSTGIIPVLYPNDSTHDRNGFPYLVTSPFLMEIEADLDLLKARRLVFQRRGDIGLVSRVDPSYNLPGAMKLFSAFLRLRRNGLNELGDYLQKRTDLKRRSGGKMRGRVMLQRAALELEKPFESVVALDRIRKQLEALTA